LCRICGRVPIEFSRPPRNRPGPWLRCLTKTRMLPGCFTALRRTPCLGDHQSSSISTLLKQKFVMWEHSLCSCSLCPTTEDLPANPAPTNPLCSSNKEAAQKFPTILSKDIDIRVVPESQGWSAVFIDHCSQQLALKLSKACGFLHSSSYVGHCVSLMPQIPRSR